MKPTLNQVLENTKSVCIMLPHEPYFDQVASALSLHLSLKNKKPLVISDTPMLVEFNRLLSINKVSQGAGNKNMVIKLINYPANQVERVTYDLDGQDLFLTVFPISGATPPTKDNISVSYTGIAADTVILVGGANESHFPLLNQKDFASMKLIHIGISDITLPGREVLSLSDASSTISELVTNLLIASEIEIPSDAATNLFMGITEGTKNFTLGNVTANTFKAASDLLSKGAKREQMKAFETRPTGTSPISSPQSQDPSVPKSWVEPKIFKGTSVS